MKKLLSLAILTITFTLHAQQPQIMECMKGLWVYTVGSTLIYQGAGATNGLIQTGGLDLISAHCSGWNTDVILWFNTSCVATNTTTIAIVTWTCDNLTPCGQGQGGGGSCGPGGSFNIDIPAGSCGVGGWIVQDSSCCGLKWCGLDPMWCGGGMPQCNFGGNGNGMSSTNNTGTDPQ